MKHLASLCFALLCAGAALAPQLGQATMSASAAEDFPGWPARFENRTLFELPLSPLEEQFQKNFPGRVGRFSDGEREIIFRWVSSASRKLHPAGDCFKANGYRLTPQPVKQVGSERWSGFLAERGATRYLVHERIVDKNGMQWTDVSAWYGSVQLGRSSGPWWAVTVAQQAKQK